MERRMIFHILGIEETKDEAAIKAAYLRLLKNTNPEDDPEGFKRLREAYESALDLARKPDEENGEQEKTEIDLWVDRVNEIYLDIRTRCDEDAWEEVLSDPLCEDLDTSLQTREALLRYLMGHSYLPHSIWQKIDKVFQIVSDRENLAQQFPGDYLNYIIFYINNQEFINYSLFEVRDKENMDVDAYIRGYLDIKRKMDNHETGWTQQLKDLAAFGVYHPYQDVEVMRLLIVEERFADAGRIADRLLDNWGDDSHVKLYCGEARWAEGKHEDAHELWQEILQELPHHYMAKSNEIRYLLEQKKFIEAKELASELLDINSNDNTVSQYMNEANEALIADYRQRIADPAASEEKRQEDTVELGWCLFQNERLDEAIGLLEDFEPNEEQEYSYENLFGRVLYRAQKYERALPHLKRWLEMIQATEDDGSEENKRRLSREFWACDMLGGCCYEMNDPEQSIRYATMAVEKADTPENKANCMRSLAFVLHKTEKYEQCIDVCDQIIAIDKQYYPAYVQRQEAAYELRKGQQVVDDYYSAIGIYTGYYKPYLLAAKVFFYHDQFEDARGVMDRAKQNEVEFTPDMNLWMVKILRNLAKNNADRDPILKLAESLLPEQDNPETDIEDVSEIEYEIALLHWDNNDYYRALLHIRKAIDKNPDRRQYRLICGHMYLDNEEYKKALAEYALAEEAYANSPSLHYNVGQCLEKTGTRVMAMERYEKALELQEGYRDALEKLADYYQSLYQSQYRREDYEKSLSYMNRQMAVRENCYYLVHRGLIYMDALDLEPAIRDFEKALEYVPTDWAAFNNLGCCYRYLGQFEKAIEYLEKARENLGEDSSVLPYSNMAKCYESLRNYEKAIECYKNIVEEFPDRKVFYKEIGLLYRYMGDYENAVKYLDMAPDDDDYYENTGDVYFLMGNTRKAIKTYERGIGKAKEKNDKADAYSALASFYSCYLFDYKKAIACYKKALSLETRNKELYELEWELAQICFMTGDFKSAKVHGQKSLDYFSKADYGAEEDYLSYPPYRPARLMRQGWAYLTAGQQEKGLSYFKQMTECIRCKQCRHPECFESYLYLGWYYEAVGEYDEALAYYKRAAQANEYSITCRLALEHLEKKVKELR